MPVFLRQVLPSIGAGLLVLALTYAFDTLEPGGRIAVAAVSGVVVLVIAFLVDPQRAPNDPSKFIHGLRARNINVDGVIARPTSGSRDFITDLEARDDISIQNVEDQGRQ